MKLDENGASFKTVYSIYRRHSYLQGYVSGSLKDAVKEKKPELGEISYTSISNATTR